MQWSSITFSTKECCKSNQRSKLCPQESLSNQRSKLCPQESLSNQRSKLRPKDCSSSERGIQWSSITFSTKECCKSNQRSKLCPQECPSHKMVYPSRCSLDLL